MEQKEITALTDLKKALLSVNGSLLRLGINKDDVTIVIPKDEFNYFTNILSSGVSGLSNFYIKIDEDTFTLSGITVTKKFKEK